MAFEKFKDIKFQSATMEIIKHAQQITQDYKARGFTLTLRQLYYQFVARDLLANKQQNYKRLGGIIDDARQTGLLDWATIEDRTRNVNTPSVWDSPEAILKAVADQYMENAWKDQKYRPEIWVEKDALMGVIEPAAGRWRIPYFACRGYASQSEIYAAGKRFQRLWSIGYTPVVFHLGDHDPSGLHMTVDNATRLQQFAGRHVEVRRLALNMDQIDQYNPPPNPAKDTDSRFEGYAAEHGDESWELDALDPDVIDQLLEDEIQTILDQDKWDASLEKEEAARDTLVGTSDHFDRVSLFLKHKDREAPQNDLELTFDELLDEID